MADVGRLRWILTADTRGFDQSMRRVSGAFRAIGRTAAGALGVAGVGAMVRNALNTADAVGKVARAVGLTVEQLQEFQFAFEESGGSAERFQRFLQQFSRQLGELQSRGGGAMATFLRDTNEGLLKTLYSAESMEQALMDLNKAVQGMDTREVNALLSAIFGRVTPGIANLLRQSPAALAGARQRAPVRFTEQMVRDAERTNDEFLRLQREFQMRMAQVVVGFFDYIKLEWQQLRDGVNALIEIARESWVGRASRTVMGWFD